MKTVLYGINDATSIVCDDIDNDEDIVIATTDGSGEFGELNVLSLEDLSNVDKGDVGRVVICSMFVGDICNSLLSIGFDIDVIHFYHLQHGEIHSCRKYISSTGVANNDILYAFYDLSKNIASFDVLYFAISAELERKKQGKKHIYFVLVPNRSERTEKVDICSAFEPDDLFWRLEQVVKPIFNMIESTIASSHLCFREEVSYFLDKANGHFPVNYTLENSDEIVSPIDFKPYLAEDSQSLCVFQASRTAQKFVDAYIEKLCGDKKLVTLTLREYETHPERNSHIEEWAKFAQELNKDKYVPVVIRDTYKCLEPLPACFNGIEVFPIAAINLQMRFALYSRAFVNMGLNTGPATLFYFIPETPAVIFIKILDQYPAVSRETMAKLGLFENENAFFRSSEDHVLFWGEDTAENIMTSFEAIAREC